MTYCSIVSASKCLKYGVSVLALAAVGNMTSAGQSQAIPRFVLQKVDAGSSVIRVQGNIATQRLNNAVNRGSVGSNSRLGGVQTNRRLNLNSSTARSIQRLNKKGLSTKTTTSAPRTPGSGNRLSTGIANDPRLKALSKTGASGAGIDKARIDAKGANPTPSKNFQPLHDRVLVRRGQSETGKPHVTSNKAASKKATGGGGGKVSLDGLSITKKTDSSGAQTGVVIKGSKINQNSAGASNGSSQNKLSGQFSIGTVWADEAGDSVAIDYGAATLQYRQQSSAKLPNSSTGVSPRKPAVLYHGAVHARGACAAGTSNCEADTDKKGIYFPAPAIMQFDPRGDTHGQRSAFDLPAGDYKVKFPNIAPEKHGTSPNYAAVGKEYSRRGPTSGGGGYNEIRMEDTKGAGGNTIPHGKAIFFPIINAEIADNDAHAPLVVNKLRGGLMVEKTKKTGVSLDGEDLLIMKESDILGIIEEANKTYPVIDMHDILISSYQTGGSGSIDERPDRAGVSPKYAAVGHERATADKNSTEPEDGVCDPANAVCEEPPTQNGILSGAHLDSVNEGPGLDKSNGVSPAYGGGDRKKTKASNNLPDLPPTTPVFWPVPYPNIGTGQAKSRQID